MTNPTNPTEINPSAAPAIETNEPSEAKPATVEVPEEAPAREAAPSEAATPAVNGIDPTAK